LQRFADPGDVMNHILAVLAAACALVSVATAAFSLRALVRIASKGPTGAQRAFEQGETIASWWNAEPVCNMSAQPRDGERFAMGGRYDSDVGDEFVEERAVYAR